MRLYGRLGLAACRPVVAGQAVLGGWRCLWWGGGERLGDGAGDGDGVGDAVGDGVGEAAGAGEGDAAGVDFFSGMVVATG